MLNKLPGSMWDIIVIFRKIKTILNLFSCNVRGPKVVIALRSSVFFWPRFFPSKSSKLLRGGII